MILEVDGGRNYINILLVGYAGIRGLHPSPPENPTCSRNQIRL